MTLTGRGHRPKVKQTHKSDVGPWVACIPCVLGPSLVVVSHGRPDKSIILGRWRVWKQFLLEVYFPMEKTRKKLKTFS